VTKARPSPLQTILGLLCCRFRQIALFSTGFAAHNFISSCCHHHRSPCRANFDGNGEINMKKMLALVVLLQATAAFAQGGPPPADGKPPAHSKQHGPSKSMAEKLLSCLEIDDETKDRLECYDAAVPPKPKPKKAGPANGVMDCRYVKEEDERLKCFNGFAEKIPKFSSR
jgi:hypothetical protein